MMLSVKELDEVGLLEYLIVISWEAGLGKIEKDKEVRLRGSIPTVLLAEDGVGFKERQGPDPLGILPQEMSAV